MYTELEEAYPVDETTEQHKNTEIITKSEYWLTIISTSGVSILDRGDLPKARIVMLVDEQNTTEEQRTACKDFCDMHYASLYEQLIVEITSRCLDVPAEELLADMLKQYFQITTYKQLIVDTIFIHDQQTLAELNWDRYSSRPRSSASQMDPFMLI